MSAAANGTADLAFKIARLVEERGWNQEDFSRIANLNRHTVRQILSPDGQRRMRNATISGANGAKTCIRATWPIVAGRRVPRSVATKAG